MAEAPSFSEIQDAIDWAHWKAQSTLNTAYQASNQATSQGRFVLDRPVVEPGLGNEGRFKGPLISDPPSASLPSAPPNIDVGSFFDDNWAAHLDLFEAKVNEGRDEFIAEFFPDMLGKLDGMADWLQDVIDNGYTGLPAHIENAIWERARVRENGAALAREDEAFTLHAARGFPLPSGQLNASLEVVRQENISALATISRDAAIKQYETAIETVKFAVQNAGALYTALIGAINDVYKAIVAYIVASSQNVQGMIDAMSNLYRMSLAYYQSLQAYSDLSLKHDVAEGELALKADELNLRVDVRAYEKQIESYIEKMKVFAEAYATEVNSKATQISANYDIKQTV